MSLKERREITQMYARVQNGVLFTLVEVRGSSYRQAGARLLAAEGGSAGTISGGCLEADLLRRAPWFVRDGARMQSFSTLFDDASEIPYGLGCGGEVSVLAEPGGSDEAAALVEAEGATLRGEQRTVVTVLPEEGMALQRFVMDDRGDVLFASALLETEDIVPMRRAALRSGHAAVHPLAQGRMFVERLEAAQRLVIFGAGEDARPLAQMAHLMGWRVAVVNSRGNRLTRERFPEAETLEVSARAGLVTREDAVVVMTHSFEQDRAVVAELLPLRPRFLGLLGARHRSALLLKEAAEMAGVSMEQAADAVHTPVGLELGGEGPEAIALAIVAEIQRWLHRERIGAQATLPRRMDRYEMERMLEQGPLQPTMAACALEAEMETETR